MIHNACSFLTVSSDTLTLMWITSHKITCCYFQFLLNYYPVLSLDWEFWWVYERIGGGRARGHLVSFLFIMAR